MLKREIGPNTGVADQPRTKRRKEVATAVQDSDPTLNDAGEDDEAGGSLKEQALRLWQTVRDAVNKEGRTLSNDFLRRPSKRQYPDYYVLIARPIALDDIKKKIEDGEYESLESVRQDFELCFKNAKQYNLKESMIWNDARELLKLTNKTYSKMVPHDDGEGNDGSKSKAPNMNRLLKTRLQKLVDKADDTGRILSNEFMELPSKKLWPIYYKIIKKPICIETIFKHLKRKEYQTSADFAADVELVFSNAMSFNQEHTQIWEDAVALRDYFRHLMADLPEPHALPEYAKPSNTKIRLKVPAISQTPSSHSNGIRSSPQATTSTKSLLLRVPAPHPPMDKTSNQPDAVPSVPPQNPAPAAATPSVQPAPLPPVSAKPSTPPPKPPVQALPTSITTARQATSGEIRSDTTYKAATPAVPIRTTASPSVNSLPNNQSTQQPASSPAPTLENQHPFKFVLLKIEPSGRTIGLDHRDGVTTWVMRLAPGEKNVRVSRIMFLEDEGEEGTDVEDDRTYKGDDDAMEVEPPAKNGRKRGRPPKIKQTRILTKSVAKSRPKRRKPSIKLDDVQIKLNGQTKATPDASVWLLELSSGSNVLEIMEKEGAGWKVHIERL